MIQGGNNTGGFTIVETLIVLAVSGALAISALIFINGRQNRTEFQTSINATQQQIQQEVNEVTSGYYPSLNNFTCTVGLGPNARPSIVQNPAGTTVNQGTNSDCIFIGKAFFLDASDQRRIYTLAGRRLVQGADDVKKPSEANAVAVGQGTSINTTAPTNLFDTIRYQSGLTYAWVKYTSLSASGAPITDQSSGQTAFAIVSKFADYGSTGSQLQSSGQGFGLYGFNNVTAGDWTAVGVVTASNDRRLVQAMDYKPAPTNKGGIADTPFTAVQLCFNSGTTDQSGLVTIGDPVNGGLGVTLQIFSGSGCSA